MYSVNDLVKSKSVAGIKDFTDYDILHSVRLSMLQTLFVVMKYFMIMEPDFPTKFHILKAFYTYAIAMKIKEKSFNIMVKLKDEAAMKITVVLDQAKIKKILDDCGVFDLDKTYEASMYRQYAGQDFIKAGTVDFRAMVKGVEKHISVAVFAHHSKGFFQSLRSIHATSLKFMGENMKFDLITGFAKMVEANISDEATDASKVPATVQFLKDKDFEGYDVPAEDIMYMDLPSKPKKKEKEE